MNKLLESQLEAAKALVNGEAVEVGGPNCWGPTEAVTVGGRQVYRVAKKYGEGSRWTVDDHECILAQVDLRKYALISLSSGNRWADPITAEESRNSIRKWRALGLFSKASTFAPIEEEND